MQEQDYLVDVEMIEDYKYNETDIQELYEKSLKKAIEKAEKEYNTAPFFPILPENIQEKDFQVGSWMVFDEDTWKQVPVTSAMELKKCLGAQQHKIMEEFKERPPFHQQEIIAQEFETQYQERLEYIHNLYPDWVVESVDKRLLALRLLPKSIFKKLQRIVKESQDLVETVEDLAEQEKKKQKEKISDHIWNIIYGELADSIILKIEKEKTSLCITIQRITEGYPEDEPVYKKITFYHCDVINREEGIVSDGTGKIGTCTLELYKQEKGYILNFLVFAKDLKYMTIKFEDIKSEIIENV